MNINQTGTWTVTAYDRNGVNLYYYVTWGDEESESHVSAAGSAQQSGTFTHSYSRTGIYTPTFTVQNTSGQSAQTSLSVNVGGVTTSSITVLSPNGGESYRKENGGSTISVNWKTNNVSPSKIIDVIRLRAYSNGREYNLATSVLNDGQEVVVLPTSVPVGAYILEMKTYVGDTLVMDSSDNYFNITSVTTQPSITVLSPNGGESLQAGGSLVGSFLSNNLSVGDTYEVALVGKMYDGRPYDRDIGYGLINSTSSHKQQISVTIPNDVPEGNYYRIRLVVGCNDSAGLCVQDQSDQNFTIATPSTQTLTVTSPNGSEIWQKGTTQTIKWTAPVNVVASYARIELAPYCTGEVCTQQSVEPYLITPKVSSGGNSFYDWKVGTASGTEAGYVEDGTYKITICQSGTNTCDTSDTYFKITSSAQNTAPKIIGFPGIPTNIQVGQTVNFSWNAIDANNDDLSWSSTVEGPGS
ncbi:MAG: PKD domain-containing protein, partial [Patescibacteria group bacterium]